eukprot:452629-Pleurochrysis_carterae.AAC.3
MSGAGRVCVSRQPLSSEEGIGGLLAWAKVCDVGFSGFSNASDRRRWLNALAVVSSVVASLCRECSGAEA